MVREETLYVSTEKMLQRSIETILEQQFWRLDCPIGWEPPRALEPKKRSEVIDGLVFGLVKLNR